jgi:hypothetical protein
MSGVPLQQAITSAIVSLGRQHEDIARAGIEPGLTRSTAESAAPQLGRSSLARRTEARRRGALAKSTSQPVRCSLRQLGTLPSARRKAQCPFLSERSRSTAAWVHVAPHGATARAHGSLPCGGIQAGSGNGWASTAGCSLGAIGCARSSRSRVPSSACTSRQARAGSCRSRAGGRTRVAWPKPCRARLAHRRHRRGAAVGRVVLRWITHDRYSNCGALMLLPISGGLAPHLHPRRRRTHDRYPNAGHSCCSPPRRIMLPTWCETAGTLRQRPGGSSCRNHTIHVTVRNGPKSLDTVGSLVRTQSCVQLESLRISPDAWRASGPCAMVARHGLALGQAARPHRGSPSARPTRS